MFLNNYWLKSSAPIFDDSQFGTESPHYWICFCHYASCKQVGQKYMLNPKCIFAHQCTCVCQVRLGGRHSASHPGGPWHWALGHSGGLLHCCVFRGLKSLLQRPRLWWPKVQKGLYMTIPVLGINSQYFLWCWNSAFLQGEINMEFAGKTKEKGWILFICSINVSGFAYS